MEEYREIELLETQLRVYRDGTIWRLGKGNRWGYEWKIVKVVVNAEGYLQIRLTGKAIKCHRIIALVYLGLDINDKKLEIDHINRIPTDNRVENLRIVTHQQNMFNKGAKGYNFYKNTGKYVARIQVNGKKKHLGYYDTAEEASKAYHDAKLLRHSF